MKITPKQFEKIKELIQVGFIKKSDISSNKLINELINCNAITKTKKPVNLLVNNETAIYGFLRRCGYKVFNFDDLEYFINEDSEPKDRIEIASKNNSTKDRDSKSFNGLMVSVFQDMEILLNNKSFILKAENGVGTFLHYTNKITIASDVIVVGVENPQIIWNIKKFRHLFDEKKKYIFISMSEYKTNYQYRWLQELRNEYIHLGDFDLAGISIYLNTILPRLKNCTKSTFLIPDSIYDYIKKIDYKKDFENQLQYIDIKSKDKDLQKLIDFIKNSKITLESEQLANFKS